MRALERSTSARWERRRRTDRVDLSSGWRTADVQKDRCASRSFLPSSVCLPFVFASPSFRRNRSCPTNRSRDFASPRRLESAASDFVARHCTSCKTRHKWMPGFLAIENQRNTRFKVLAFTANSEILPLLSELSDYCALPSVSRFHQIGKRRPLINAHARYLIYMHQFLKFLSYSSVTD